MGSLVLIAIQLVVPLLLLALATLLPVRSQLG